MGGKREVWFVGTILWGGRAVHWKGIALIALGGAGCASGIWAAARYPRLGVAVFVVSWLATMIVAELHTGPRKK